MNKRYDTALLILFLIFLGCLQYEFANFIGRMLLNPDMMAQFPAWDSVVPFYAFVAFQEETIKLLGGFILFLALGKFLGISMAKAVVLSALAFSVMESYYYIGTYPCAGVLAGRLFCAIPMHVVLGMYVGKATKDGFRSTAIAFSIATACHMSYNISCTLGLEGFTITLVSLSWFGIVFFADEYNSDLTTR